MTVVAWFGPSAARSPHVLRDMPVSAERLSAMPAHNSPLLAVDPTNTNFVVIANRLDNPDFDCALHLSGDGGRVWVQAGETIKLPKGADKCYAPEAGFDSHGVLHYLFVGLSGTGNRPMGVFVASSMDRAQTFSVPRRVLGPGNYQVRMAMDPTIGERGRMYLVWLHVPSDAPLGGFPPPPNPLMAAYSDDGGTSFSPPVQVSDLQRSYVVAPAVAVIPGQGLHVAYLDLKKDARDYHGLEGPPWEGTWSLITARSFDRGRSFLRGVVVDDEIVPYDRVMLVYTMPPPSIAASDSGDVYVAWDDARRGDPDAWLSRSADGGSTWSAPIRLNDDRVGNDRHQYMPRLSVAPSGRLDAIFYDRRRDADNIRADVFYSFSSNGGKTFSRNVKVTTDSSDSRIGTSYPIPSALGRPERGSRVALLSNNSSVLAAWTDTRNSYVGTAAQDIFSTEIRFRRGGPAWSMVVTILFAGVGLIRAGCCMRRLRSRRKLRINRTCDAPLNDPMLSEDLNIYQREYSSGCTREAVIGAAGDTARKPCLAWPTRSE